MEKLIDFTTITVTLDQLYLDPNNLRFANFNSGRKLVGAEVKDEAVQKTTYDRLKEDEFQVRALRDSIVELGFLSIDKIVVAKIDEESYLVVEGNRRVAALKWVLELINEKVVSEEVGKTFAKIEVNVITSQSDNEINRLKIQGIRHISEIRPWGTYQKAVLIKSMIEGEKLSATEVANAIGYRTQEVNRIYKAYKLLEQMQNDPDYGEFAKPELTIFFYEAVGRNPIKRYLGYNETSFEFENEDTYKLFYKWIIRDPENGFLQKIPSSTNVRDLTKIIANDDALMAFKEDSTTLQSALAIVIRYASFDWKKEVTQAAEVLKKIPMDELENFSEDDITLLTNLKEIIEKRLNNYDKIANLK